MKKQFTFLLLFLLAIQYIAMGNPPHDEFKVLVFSRTAGFRHGSIPQGIAAIQQLGLNNHFAVVATEDPTAFNLANLQQYACVIFLSTTGDVLDATQQTAFENYIRGGGGYVGIHAASDTENSWAWYGQLVGAYFATHPAVQQATVKVSDRVHPSTKSLPTRWVRTDEWYNFNQNPRGKVHVLATLDETSYTGGTHGTDHPIAWCQTFENGRSWYTGGGHEPSNFSEPHFLNHVLGGIMYSAGRITGSFEATDEANYELTVLDNAPANPMALEVMPDGKVIYVERDGRVKVFNPATSTISLAAQFTVDTQREDGLLGVALPPDFATTQWVYLFYSPVGAGDIQRVSRFKFTNNAIDKATEQVVLTIPTQRVTCCHSGGYLKFDGQGNLFIATGDNVNPFESDGYNPIDERAGRSTFDSQGTSGNTKDLRGKILRIKPSATTGYTIPTGNLFTDANIGKPEIYVMGVRNPFRMGIDKKTNYLYWGDVGPDAGADNGNRGPRGHDEWNRTNTAGNFGWPYLIANNKPYKDYNFATATSGPDFNPNAIVNNSPNNTGSANLPPAKPAWIWYPYNQAPDFPQIAPLAGGRTAMGGPVYNYDSTNNSAIKMPAYFDNSVFIYEWSNNWFKEVKLDETGNILAINPILTTFTFSRPMDMHIGPDGAFYIIEWGTGFGGGNPNARIIKIGYKTGARNPVAIITATPKNGPIPLNVSFSASQSYDPDPGNTLSYFWDFDNNGTDDATGVTATRTFSTRGIYPVRLKVRDNTGREATSTIQIVAGNNAPVVNIISPVNGGFYSFNDNLPYNVQVTDVEDGAISCSSVTIRPATGHNDHAHDENTLSGCSGTFNAGAGHGGGENDPDNIFLVLNATYADKGFNNDPAYSISTTATNIFNVKRMQAEHFEQSFGVQTESTSDVLGGGLNLSFIDNNDYISFKPVNLQNIHNVTFRAASNGAGGFIEIHADSPTGQLLSRRSIPVNGDWQFYNYYSAPITDPGGTHEIFVVFKGGTGVLFNLNWIDFYGQGLATSLSSTIQGLKATYYSANNFTGTQVTRNEPVVSFDWEANTPASGIPAENFSADWVGTLKPPVSTNYTLVITGTNGTAEVFINNTSVARAVNATVQSTPVSLVAGTSYNVRIAYQHTTGSAGIQLQWKYNGAVNASVVPKDYLSISLPPTSAPVISSSGTASGVVGSAFNYAITASNAPTSYGATGLPSGLSVNTSTGVISGTPAATGNFNITVSATNAIGTGTKAVAITISNPPPCTAPYINVTSTAPTIDTSIDAVWSNATVGSINNVTLGARPADFTGSQWRALYDNTNLYILVEVKDANRFNDSGANWWEDDVVEIFIDGNNSKGTSYDGVNDFQYGFRYNDTALKVGGNSVNRTTGVTFTQHNVTNGYNIEVRIPWSTIGVTPIAGNKIGFDISIDDDDNGGVRDAQMSSFATTSNAYANPSLFGSVTLCGGVTAPVPVVSNTSLPTGTAGTAYNTIITATNSPTSFGATGLPAGLSVNTSSGVISGTPTASGTFTVTLSATNASGTGTKQLSLVINPAGVAPVVSNTSLPTGTVGTAYNTTVTASNNPTSFGATGLPAGLSLNTSSGVISGTPTASGTFAVTLSATNASGTGTKQLSLVVNPAGAAPVVSNTSLPTGTVGTAYNTTITATNNPTSRNATGLPAGLSVNTSTGVISGTPTASGTFTVTLSATNASGTGTKQLSLVVNPAGAAPVVSNTSLPTGTVGTAYNTTITATNNPTSRNATGLPAGLSVNTSTGVISGTPTASGTFTVTLSATNASGTGTKQLSLVVNPAGDPPGVVTCLRTSGTITVNGTLAETNWNSVITKSISKSISGSPNNTATFGVLWDNTNLYVGVRVLDANLHSDSPNTWDDDAVEVYIDANNNKLTTYDGRDNQIIKNYNKSTVFTKLAVTGLQHGWAAITGGYSVELAIPWSQLGVAAPAAGQNYGFDVGYDDDDNAGARDHQAVWNGTINNYQNTSAFGTLTLSNTAAARMVAEETEASSVENVKIVYWPNPVDNEINITTDGSYEALEVMDMLGKSIYRDETIFGKTNIKVDMSSAAAGVHLIRLSGKSKCELIQVIKK